MAVVPMVAVVGAVACLPESEVEALEAVVLEAVAMGAAMEVVEAEETAVGAMAEGMRVAVAMVVDMTVAAVAAAAGQPGCLAGIMEVAPTAALEAAVVAKAVVPMAADLKRGTVADCRHLPGTQTRSAARH